MEGTAERREGAAASADVKNAVASAHAALAAHASKIDALNVYPVPDGDTGTNMLLTLRSILEEAMRLRPKDRRLLLGIARQISPPPGDT